MLWVGVYDISTISCDLEGTDHAKCTRIASLNGQTADGISEGRSGHRS